MRRFPTQMTNGTRQRQRLFTCLVLAAVLVIFPRHFGSTIAFAQELTAQELIPLGDELAPAERLMTEESLRFAAELSLNQWQALEADPNARSFDAYFEIFREVARIESFEHATKTAGIDVRSPLVKVASSVRAEMDAKGLSAREAGIRALETLVEKLDAPLATGGADSLAVRYTLILDYISGIDVARLAIALADRLDLSGHQDMARDIYANFLTLYFDRTTTAQERMDLVALASTNGSKMAGPAVFRVLTNLVRMAPRAEKAELAQVAFRTVDTSALDRLTEVSANTDSLVPAAWLGAAELAQGLKTEDELVGLREQARDSLETPAFEILALAVKDETVRSRIVSDAVRADVKQKRALIGYDRALNLLGEPERAPEAYFALLESFAEEGYSNYVRSLGGRIADRVRAGSLILNAEQSAVLLRAVETTADQAFVASLKGSVPSLASDLERSALRAGILSIFSPSVEQAIGSKPISIGSGVNQALMTAANLVNGVLPEQGSLAVISPANGDDLELLSKVAGRLWQYSDRRKLLVGFMAGEASIELKQAIALGVTGFMGFEVGKGAGVDFAVEVGKILSSTKGDAHNLLSASVGEVAQPTGLWGEALQRYVRYLASTGRSLTPLSATLGDEDGKIVNAAAAAFENVHLATDQLKPVDDYRARVASFRRLAEARASVLDDKGWLNSAIHPVAFVSTALGAAAVDTSDGRISVAATDKDAVPTSGRPFMPNLLVGRDAVASKIPVPAPRDSDEALADIAERGETRATRLIRFSSEHFDEIVNLGVREYLYLNSGTAVPRMIFVTHGVMTMGELVAQVRATAPDAITLEGGDVTLNVPLAVNDGASLIVSGQEIKSLKFNTKAGAFLVNSGKIYFDNVTVSSFDRGTGLPSYVSDYEKGVFFRPFIVSWGGSETYALNTRFVALGYAGGRTYGLSLSTDPMDVEQQVVKSKIPRGVFVDNSFENLYYGFYAYEAEDVVFVGNELVKGVIYGLDPHDRSKNLMMAYNTAYGTQKKHGIIISREVDDSFILGNLSFENHGTGIMLDRESYGTVVYANDASRNNGDGFSALESPCTFVGNNMFYGNGRTGIKIRNSWDVQVDGNWVTNNKSAGIESYIDHLELSKDSEFRDFRKDPYSPLATIAARANIVQSNGLGIRARGASEVRLFGNRFINQLPRYVGGDLKSLALDIVTKNMQSGVVARSVCMPRIQAHKECSLAKNGVISAQSHQPEFTGAQASADLCIKSAGSPQSAAFNAPEGE